MKSQTGRQREGDERREESACGLTIAWFKKEHE
jgi:hypothetical protein